MSMHLIIAVLFAVTVVLAFIEDRLTETHKLAILAGYILIMVTLAATKSIEHTADAIGYEDMFYNNDDVLIEITTEPTYIYLSRIILACGGTVSVLFLIYALITIPAKMLILNRMTPYIFTALVVYIPIYFEVHDLIQIRAAAAATFLTASLLTLPRRQYLLTALLVACAILFHYSSVCYIPLLLIGNRKLSPPWRLAIACLVPLSFAMYLLKLDLFSLIPSFLVEGKLDFYQKTAETGDWEELSAPYLNLYFLAKCAVLFLCLYYYDRIVERHSLAPITINLFAASIIFLLTMAPLPVIAGRISDMYGVIDGIVFTYCLTLVSPKYVARTAIALAALFMLIYNMVNTEYFF